MAGSLQKRGKHSWRLAVSAGFDPVTGRRRQVRRTVRGSKREAELALARLVVEVQGGAHVEQSRMPLAAYLRERYLVKARTRLRPETWDRYESLLRIHVIPRIGSLPLEKLRPSHIDWVMAEMTAGGAAPASVRQAYRVLSRALKEAVRLQLISANPAERVDPPRVPRAVLHVPTKEGLAKLLDGIRDSRWASPIAFAVGTGLRRGELLGLRWPDVDFDRRCVNVNWELQRHRGRGLVFVEPKTDRARREVRLSPALVAMLQQVRVEQEERRSLLGPVWQEHGVVFDAGEGRPIDPDYFTEACKRTFRAVGMPDAMRLHDLRHAFGSLLFAAGCIPRSPQLRWGTRARHSRCRCTSTCSMGWATAWRR